nr:gasdermin-E [Nothobranchius furzeri]
MFSKATANFVHQIDPEGSLIYVSRVNDSKKLLPMAIVVKRNRIWRWQRPKYQPTDFTLSDLLQGDETLQPGVSETEFLSYKGTFSDEHTGKLDTETGPIHVKLEGLGMTKLQSCFGKLRKEELEVKNLLKGSNNRLVNMQHILVQQIEKRAEVLVVVKERILTTNSCSVMFTRKQQCTFQGVLRLLGLLGTSIKICGKDVNSFEADSDVSLEIPSGTVIAYSVLELEIKTTGHFNICLQPGTIGGFESDSVSTSESPDPSVTVVDGKINDHEALGDMLSSSHQNGSQELELAPLAALPQATRYALFRKLQETLSDRSALGCIQCVLEEMCCSKTVLKTVIDTQLQVPGSSFNLTDVELDSLTGSGQSDVPAHLGAAHLLVSAMEELPDETLSILSESRPDFLAAFDTLMSQVKESREPSSVQSLPAQLQDIQLLQQAEQLLGSIGAMLRRDADRVWVEAGNADGVLLLVLGLGVRGLSLLCTGLL